MEHRGRAALRLPAWSARASLPPESPPVLLVLVDAEEEFDWSRDFDRAETSVRSIARLDRAQRICDEFGIRPTYVVDYPVASQPDGAAPIREFLRSGRATVGAHLHPWVSPPHDEEVSARNSFPGNLPRELEAEKLRRLVAVIESSIGARPVVYQAGRYGLGAHTAATLEELGFEVDFSSCPPFDFRPDGGPDYTHCPLDAYWFGQQRRLLGVPVTGAFVGWLGGWSHSAYRCAASRVGSALHLPGVLARLRAVDRLRLSPEGFETAHHRRLVEALIARGVRTFTWSFHAPSLLPGATPYARDEAEVTAFLDRCRRFFEWFLRDAGGEASTPLDLKRRLESA